MKRDEGFSWTNRRAQVRITLSFCRYVYAVCIAITAGAFFDIYSPDESAWSGLAGILTANTAVYVATISNYLFGPVFENRAIAMKGRDK